MPEQKLTIIPVTLHPETEKVTSSIPTKTFFNSTCTIKSGNVEIFLSNGVDEHIIQTVMREMKNL
ncbi:hypothetical protein [Bacillus kwashiorkori]|uniref:hypothetical protein n=1 Tax=Bacillus kwashiorkori TaxID=1522318 RepID=UPI000782A533|nr:hypothetical protein [Bacillus kwashiorkori]